MMSLSPGKVCPGCRWLVDSMCRGVESSEFMAWCPRK